MKRIAFLVVMMVMALSLAHLLAQDKKKKPQQKPVKEVQAPEPNYTVDDSTEVHQAAKTYSTETRYFLFPQFYSYWPVYNNDTLLRYECYDINHNPLLVDTLDNANDIQYIAVVKTYNDYLKTYVDPEGKPRPQPVSRTLFTFERTGTDTWKSIDVASNYSVSLLEHKDHIIRKDTTMVSDPITGTKQVTIREYYKVSEVEGSEATAPSTVSSEISANEIFYYTVPEFYFHWPKKSRDTLFEFECYDDRDSVILNVANYDSVHYFSLLKKFADSTHTYKDDDGKRKPLPVSLIVKRYDHLSKDKWMSVEYPGNKFTELKAFKDAIVSVDTEAIVDPVSGHEQMKIYRHYKVIKN